MGKIVIYIRVSSKEQLEGSSLEIQERVCTDYAIRNSYEIEKVFVEKGESAKTTDRTELKKLIDYVVKNAKTLEAVLIYKIDRLARNTLDHAQLKLLFNKYGLKLLSATENLEDTPVGRLIENQLAGFAQFDNEVRAERCRNGMMAAVKAGRYVWNAPLGFANVGTRGNSNITPRTDNPEQLRLVRKIWDYLDNGFSPEETRKAITKDGLVGNTGKPVSKSSFHKMIRNKVYMGIIEKFGLSVVGNPPLVPLVDPEVFMRVLDKLDNKSRKMPIYKKDNEDFPLRGFVKCVDCGRYFTASWSKGNGGKYAYYRCTECSRKNYKRDDVESKFMRLLSGYNYKNDLKELLVLAIEANLEHRQESSRKTVEKLERQLLSLKAQAKLIAEKNFKGVLTDSLAKEMLDENQSNLNKVTLELNQYNYNQLDIVGVSKRGISVLEDIGGIWYGIDLDVKKRFQKFLFPDGILYDGEDFRTIKTALCIEKKWQEDFQKSTVVTPQVKKWNKLWDDLVWLFKEFSLEKKSPLRLLPLGIGT